MYRTDYINQEEAYKNFVNSIDSEITKQNYRRFFMYFMDFCKKETFEEMLRIGPLQLEGLI